MRLRWIALVALVLAPNQAAALVWPDVPERLQRELDSPTPSVRRDAAQQLRTLGHGRGGALVLHALADADAEVRVAAAESAIHLRVAAATFAVLPWLGDPETRIRAAACEVARALPDPRAVPPLSRALGDADPAVRAAAAGALGSQASADAVAPLLGKLDDTNPTVRVEVVRALARLGDPRAVVPLVGKVQDSAGDVRQAVARALGELADARASQALVLELRDNVDEVRVEALVALGRLRAADAADAVAPLAQDRKSSVRQAAIATLGRIATRSTIHTLVAMLGAGEDGGGGTRRTPLRDALVTAGASALPDVVTVLQSAPAAAASAAWVLGQLHAHEYTPELVAAMRRGTLPVAAALHALSGAGGSDSVPIVLEFVDDPSPLVRAEALDAIESLLDPSRPDGRAVEPLSAALGDPRLSATERAKVAGLLGRTGAARAAPVLTPLVGGQDLPLRLAALDALATIGPTNSDGALLEQLSDPDATVRLHAAVALGDAGGPRARDALLAKLDNGDELDRPAVLTALGGMLSREPSVLANRRLERTLDLSAGPERDALLVALGRGATPLSSAAFARFARGDDVDDRRTVATVLAAGPGRATATPLLLEMLADIDPHVRAQAAWSLGEIGDAATIHALELLVAGADIDVATNATAAVARIAARDGNAGRAASLLCPRLGDTRPFVRANALAGLALSGARCGNGATERRLLREDIEIVRAAAARTLAGRDSPEDARALEHCAAVDRSGAVALLCRATHRLESPRTTHAVEVYVVNGVAADPSPRSDYAIEFADGLIRVGEADRRGAMFDPAAPEGDVVRRRTTDGSPLQRK